MGSSKCQLSQHSAKTTVSAFEMNSGGDAHVGHGKLMTTDPERCSDVYRLIAF